MGCIAEAPARLGVQLERPLLWEKPSVGLGAACTLHPLPLRAAKAVKTATHRLHSPLLLQFAAQSSGTAVYSEDVLLVKFSPR